MRAKSHVVTPLVSKVHHKMHRAALLLHACVYVVMIAVSRGSEPFTQSGSSGNLTTKQGIAKAEKIAKDHYENGRVSLGRFPSSRAKDEIGPKVDERSLDENSQNADDMSLDGYKQRRNAQKRRVNGNVWSAAFGGAQAIPYAFDPNKPFINQALAVEKINEAIQAISATTCVRFVEVNASFTGDMILFKSSDRCFSFVGRVGGAQAVELFHSETATCLINGIIVHEILHALGHFHEQVRSDRDTFIKLYPSNIEAGFANNFDITNLPLLAKYDYQSVLHYGPRTFALPGTVVFRTIPNGAFDFLTGQRVKMSYYDVLTMNIAYRCKGGCDSQIDCNKGYAVKTSTGDCVCKCPEHISGPNCEDVVTDTGCGGLRLLQNVGDSVQVTFQSMSGDDARKCVYVIQGPSGSVINLQSSKFDMGLINRVSSPENTIEVRSNLIGQDGPEYGGRASLGYISTKEHFQENALMLVYREGATSVSGPSSAVFVATATDVRDPCLDIPCGIGATCVPHMENLTYTCECAPRFIGANCTELDPYKLITDDFEDSTVVLMLNVGGDDFDWTRHSGSTRTSGTGPSSGNGSPNYMYCEASFPVKNNHKAILSSASDFPLSNGRCISFCLHMYGSTSSMSNFELVLYYSDGARLVRFNSNQNRGNKWMCEKITIDPRTDGVTARFTFEYTRRSFKADVGVDNVQTWPGSCSKKPATSCPQPSPATEASIFDGEKSSYEPGDELIYTCNPGHLFLSGNLTRMCQIDGTWSGQPPVCRNEVNCPEPPEVKNSFISEGLQNSYQPGNHLTYVCIVDFELIGSSRVTCQADSKWSEAPSCKRVRFACDFESSAHPLCNFLVQSEADDRDWSHVISDTTSTINTGPSFASNRFGYVYFESSRPAKTGDTASLEAIISELTDGGPACVRLSLSMYGDTMGSFTIMGDNSELMTRSNGSNDWQTVAVTAPQGTQKISFRATRGTSCRSDIAIDNLRITVDACNTEACDSRPCFHVDDSDYSSSSTACTCACPAGLKGDTCDVIDFGTSTTILTGFELTKKNPLGIFKQLHNDSSDLTFRNGGSNTPYTGPASPAEGETYLYYDGSSPNPPFSTASLESALIQDNVKVELRYHMFGKNEGKLEIFQREEGRSNLNLLRSYAGQSCGKTYVQSKCPWSYDSFDASKYSGQSPGYRLVFVFTLGYINDFRTDIAIDSVVVSKLT